MIRRHNAPCVVAAVAVVVSGCSGITAPHETSPNEDQAHTSATATEAPEASGTDPLSVTAVDQLPGGIDEVARAGDGSTVVVVASTYDDVSSYRIYDEGWRPTTPPLRVGVTLFGLRGMERGFAAWAVRTRRGGYSFRERVVIGGHGQVRTARPGVGAIPRPDWRTSRTVWFDQPDGSVCAVQDGSEPGGLARSSLDGGRTWRVVDTSDLPPQSGRLQSCVAAGDRVVVMTGGARPRQLHTYDRSDGTRLSSLDIGAGTQIDPYAWWLLSDGSLVARTDRPGVVVATDSTNRHVEFRGGPVGSLWWTRILDDQIVQVSAEGVLAVSDDRGVSWHVVDL